MFDLESIFYLHAKRYDTQMNLTLYVRYILMLNLYAKSWAPNVRDFYLKLHQLKNPKILKKLI